MDGQCTINVCIEVSEDGETWVVSDTATDLDTYKYARICVGDPAATDPYIITDATLEYTPE
jgi:hypothetical protein